MAYFLNSCLQERCPTDLKSREVLQEALHLRISLVSFPSAFILVYLSEFLRRFNWRGEVFFFFFGLRLTTDDDFFSSWVLCLTPFNAAVRCQVTGPYYYSSSSALGQSLLTRFLPKSKLLPRITKQNKGVIVPTGTRELQIFLWYTSLSFIYMVKLK